MDSRNTRSSTKVKCRRTGTPRIVITPMLPERKCCLGWSWSGTISMMRHRAWMSQPEKRDAETQRHRETRGERPKGNQLSISALCSLRFPPRLRVSASDVALGLPQIQHFIQRSLPVPLQIQRDILEAERLEDRRKPLRHLHRHGALHFVPCDLDARHFSME